MVYVSTVGGQVSPQRFRAVLAKVTEWVWVFSELGAFGDPWSSFRIVWKIFLDSFFVETDAACGGVESPHETVALRASQQLCCCNVS